MGTEIHSKKKLFRACPPLSLVERIVRSCGLIGLDDLRWFTADELTLDGYEEWLPELEAYYLPCKARRFFYERGELTGARMITLLKHILSCHRHTLQVHERAYKDNKHATLYQIQPTHAIKDLSGVSLTVNFD
jgi:hypothetical protein